MRTTSQTGCVRSMLAVVAVGCFGCSLITDPDSFESLPEGVDAAGVDGGGVDAAVDGRVENDAGDADPCGMTCSSAQVCFEGACVQCVTTADCVEEQYCSDNVCASCDADGDGFAARPECGTERPIDCDDSDPDIQPVLTSCGGLTGCPLPGTSALGLPMQRSFAEAMGQVGGGVGRPNRSTNRTDPLALVREEDGAWTAAWLTDPDASAGFSDLVFARIGSSEGVFASDQTRAGTFGLTSLIDVEMSDTISGLVAFVGNASDARLLEQTPEGIWEADPVVGDGLGLDSGAAYGLNGVVFWRKGDTGRSATTRGTTQSPSSAELEVVGGEVASAGDLAITQGRSAFVLWTDSTLAPRPLPGLLPLGDPRMVTAGLSLLAVLPGVEEGSGRTGTYVLAVAPTCVPGGVCGSPRALEGPDSSTMFAVAANDDFLFVADVLSEPTQVLLYVFSVADIEAGEGATLTPLGAPRPLFTGPSPAFEGAVGAIEMRVHETSAPNMVELSVLVSAAETLTGIESNAYLHVMQFCF